MEKVKHDRPSAAASARRRHLPTMGIIAPPNGGAYRQRSRCADGCGCRRTLMLRGSLNRMVSHGERQTPAGVQSEKRDYRRRPQNADQGELSFSIQRTKGIPPAVPGKQAAGTQARRPRTRRCLDQRRLGSATESAAFARRAAPTRISTLPPGPGGRRGWRAKSRRTRPRRPIPQRPRPRPKAARSWVGWGKPGG